MVKHKKKHVIIKKKKKFPNFPRPILCPYPVVWQIGNIKCIVYPVYSTFVVLFAQLHYTAFTHSHSKMIVNYVALIQIKIDTI